MGGVTLMQPSLMRELRAEFLGTFILMIFGLGVNAQVTLGDGGFGDFYSVNMGWGLAVTMGVYVAGGISGAHLNPAVTIALACLRGFAWNKVVPFILVQIAAAFVASAMIYAVYFDALNHYDGGTREVPGPTAEKATAGIWATYPQEYVRNIPGGFLDQALGTALLLLMIFALTDEKNTAPMMNLAPVLIGAIVFLVGMCFGYNCGYAINPARDFGPRLFTYVAGWGPGVWTAHNYFFWVPIAGPIVGGVIGGWIYDVMVAKHHPPEIPAA